MGKIIILDENTANQIAAGEVIERPSSIIKELVENSIDANATIIRIEIIKGGVSFIRITDNGDGIAKDDVEMAFERHGTSKIKSAIDLSHIDTMGFRGEALASVASVADVTLISKTKDDKTGTSIHIKGGEFQTIRNVAKEPGTTITVRSLFYNTPARFKFLKNDTTETRYCNEIINKIALGNPQIAISFISNKKELLQTPGDNQLVNTIYAIYGKQIANSLFIVQSTNEGMTLSGYVGKQTIARGNRAHQSIFINHRAIKSIEITKAVEKAYESTLMKGRFPFFVLNLSINPSLVDVNVHPAKLEVRFSNAKEIFSLVYRAVKAVIEETNTIYYQQPKEEIPKTFSFNSKVNESTPTYDPTYVEKQVFHDQMKQVKEQFKHEPISTLKNTDVEIKDDKSELIGNYLIIGQLFKTYVILQREDDILLLDQHACHERITYEKLLKKYENHTLKKQLLMVPIEVRLTNSEMNLVFDNKERIEKMGFEVDQFSDQSIVIRSVPTDILGENARDVFISAIDNLNKDDHEALYMMACKNSIKANHKLSHEEIREMVSLLGELTNPFNCPHGRPTIIKMTKYELEKRFKRIV